MLLLASVVSLASLHAHADSAKPPAVGAEPRQIAEEAMAFITADDMSGFIAMVRRKMPMPAGEIEKVDENLKSQRKEVTAKLGKILGFALVSECRRADFLLRLIYAEKREKNALRWQFIFYKARDKWQWVHFNWDSDTPQMFASCA
jgi:hypothetical protein